MSDLTWIAAVFVLVYGAIGTYTTVLEMRRRRARARTQEVA